ncbi:hypothetical protein [Nitrospira sp. M1]
MLGLLLILSVLLFQSPITTSILSSQLHTHSLPVSLRLSFHKYFQSFDYAPQNVKYKNPASTGLFFTEYLAEDPEEMDQELVSIETLLKFPERFHQKMVTVRGIVKQPEMHLDKTELFFDFVFVLEKDSVSLIVFGRHDRTQGGSSIAMGNYVEVTGIFWKDRETADYHFENNLEALTITPYPSLTPDRTSFTQRLW